MANNFFLEPLNVAKGNMYEFVSHTWNPIKGICFHQCKYCYMRNLLSERYKCKPVLVDNEFKRNLDEAKVLFVGSSIDMFTKDVPDAFIMRVLNHCALFNESRPEKGHIVYLFQSKNPARILQFANHPALEHAVVATTLETNRYDTEIMGHAPTIDERASAMGKIAEMGIYTMVTAEPLMDFDKEEFVELIKRCKPRRVNIGRNSTRNIVLPEPTADKVKDLVSTLREFTRVHIKNNAKVWLVE